MSEACFDDVKQLAIEESQAVRLMLEGGERKALVIAMVDCGSNGVLRIASPSDRMTRGTVEAFIEMLGSYRDKLQQLVDGAANG